MFNELQFILPQAIFSHGVCPGSLPVLLSSNIIGLVMVQNYYLLKRQKTISKHFININRYEAINLPGEWRGLPG